MQSSLVGFINDHATVGFEVRLSQEFSEQHSISHVFYYGTFGGAVFKSNGISYFIPELDAELFGNTSSNAHGCNSSRLCATNFHSIYKQNIIRVIFNLSWLIKLMIYHHKSLLL